MCDRILFPTDGSEAATAVLAHAADVAETYDATLHVLTVDGTDGDGSDADGEPAATGERIVADAAERVADRDLSVETAVRRGVPHSAILDYADERDVDLIVMSTRGRTGLERLLLGSVTERVVRRSDVPVLTVRADGADVTYPYRRVLVPTDGSDCATAALDVGIDAAKTHGAALHVLSVVDTASLGIDVQSELQIDALDEAADEIVARGTERAEAAGVEDVTGATDRERAIHRAIRSYVDEHDVDLVVVGTHGRSGIDRYLLGSVAEKLVRTSPVPVLTVREPADA